MVGRGAETDQGTAGGAGMGAENLLARFGIKEALGGRDAFDFAAAKPEATVVVEVTAVAETVINAAGRGNFRERGRFGQGVVGLGHDGTGGDDFADFSGREFAGGGEVGERSVGGGDDLDGDLGDRATER